MTYYVTIDLGSSNTLSSSSDSILEYLDYIYNSMNNPKSLLAIFLDFSKAFDAANHAVLLQKCQHMVLKGPQTVV